MHVFLFGQFFIVNKQLASPLSWKYLLSETALGESYILMIYRRLDAEEIEEVYKI